MRTIKLTNCNVHNFQTTKSYYLVQVLQANEVTSVRSKAKEVIATLTYTTLE